MDLLRFSDRLPQCSRCRGDLIMSGVAPQNDEHGRPIHMELCPACDTGDVNRPAAGLLVQWLLLAGHPSRPVLSRRSQVFTSGHRATADRYACSSALLTLWAAPGDRISSRAEST
jgi:hypothetical protein